MAEELTTWERVIKLFQNKPELVEEYLDLKIDRDTLVVDYKIKSARNVRSDMIFRDPDGKRYMVKINFEQSPLFGLRDVSLWAKRYAEDEGVYMTEIIPALICDEDCVNEYHNIKELNGWKIKYATYKKDEILKMLEDQS